MDHSVLSGVYLDPLLFPRQEQNLYRTLDGLADISFLELLDQLIANKEIELEVVLALLGQLDVLEHHWQAMWLFPHPGCHLLNGPHEHLCIFAADSQAHQQLVDVDCEGGVADGQLLQQLSALIHLQVRQQILHMRFYSFQSRFLEGKQSCLAVVGDHLGYCLDGLL